MAGRRPKPTSIKALQGTLRKDRTNEKEPQPEPLPPDPPDHLGKEAKKYWKETFKLLAGVGVLTEMDSDTLSLYCETKAKWVYAKKQLEKNGLVIIAQSGFPVQSPWLQICNKCFDQMLKISTEFGMTPSSRTRIKVEFPEKEDDDPMAVLRRSIAGRRKKPNPFDEF